MLTYELKKAPGVPLYEALYRCIRSDILTGRLAAGEKLPSKRALAAHLEVSKVTVDGKTRKSFKLVPIPEEAEIPCAELSVHCWRRRWNLLMRQPPVFGFTEQPETRLQGSRERLLCWCGIC